MRLIDADKAYEVLTEIYHHKTEAQHTALKEALSMVPTAEPVKTGKWIAYGLEEGFALERHVCSECGYDIGVITTPCCPNCGARMEAPK